MPAYEYFHVAGFGETSLVGNVYFSAYLEWQGECREHFLAEHAREVLGPLSRREVAFFTKSCTCEWNGGPGFEGLDRVLVRMRLAGLRGGRMSLEFTYSHAERPDEVVATGTQEVHCKARSNPSAESPRSPQSDAEWVPRPFPPALLRALLAFADTEELRCDLRDALEFQLGVGDGLGSGPGACQGS